MRFASKILFLVFSLAAWLPAAAQTKAGTFTLSHETRWNNVSIPAGEYSIAIFSENSQIAMLRPASGNHSSVFLVPVAHDYNSCASSTISLVNNAGEWSAQSVCFADSGLTLYFARKAPVTGLMASISKPVAAGSK